MFLLPGVTRYLHYLTVCSYDIPVHYWHFQKTLFYLMIHEKENYVYIFVTFCLRRRSTPSRHKSMWLLMRTFITGFTLTSLFSFLLSVLILENRLKALFCRKVWRVKRKKFPVNVNLHIVWRCRERNPFVLVKVGIWRRFLCFRL